MYLASNPIATAACPGAESFFPLFFFAAASRLAIRAKSLDGFPLDFFYV